MVGDIQQYLTLMLYPQCALPHFIPLTTVDTPYLTDESGGIKPFSDLSNIPWPAKCHLTVLTRLLETGHGK
jgi:hypothetical protein